MASTVQLSCSMLSASMKSVALRAAASLRVAITDMESLQLQLASELRPEAAGEAKAFCQCLKILLIHAGADVHDVDEPSASMECAPNTQAAEYLPMCSEKEVALAAGLLSPPRYIERTLGKGWCMVDAIQKQLPKGHNLVGMPPPTFRAALLTFAREHAADYDIAGFRPLSDLLERVWEARDDNEE